MLKVLRVIIYILVVLVCAYMGAEIGAREAERYDAGAHIPWQNQSLSQGHRAKNFIVGDRPAVGVRTDTGTIFIRSIIPGEARGWVEGNEGDLIAGPGRQRYAAGCSPDSLPIKSEWTPDPPGTVVSEIYCVYHPHAEAMDSTWYVILSDGSIWSWGISRGVASGFSAPLFFSMLCGVGIVGGATVGIIVVIVLELGGKFVNWISRRRSA